MRLAHHRLLLLALICCCANPLAQAQDADLPKGVVKIVVGFAPGGAADTTARVYAEALSRSGLPNVIVENRPGASARIGFDYVRRSVADGLTLSMSPSTVFTLYPLTYQDFGAQPEKDMRAVAQLVDIPTAVIAGVDRPYRTMGEYLDWMKRNPTQVTLGLASLGTSGHLATAAVGKSAGVEVTPVIYRGASPMAIDVASGSLSSGWDAVASFTPIVQSGKVRFLGISGNHRLAALPDVPTMAEQGFPQYEPATSFYGIWVPTATPDATVAALQRAFNAAAKDPDLKSKLEAAGLIVAPATATEMTARELKEREFWRPIVKDSGISLE